MYAAGGYYYPGKDIPMLLDEMKSYIISYEGGLTTFGWVSTLAPLGLVMMIGFGFNKYSVNNHTYRIPLSIHVPFHQLCYAYI